jgi:membrane fusion protein, heavy metal efflux system
LEQYFSPVAKMRKNKTAIRKIKITAWMKTSNQKLNWSSPKNNLSPKAYPLTGAIEPNPDKVIHFVSLVGGIISNTNFSLGDKVTKGQVLAELRSTELSELQSQSKTILSQIKVAEKNLQSMQSMFDDGIASKRI